MTNAYIEVSSPPASRRESAYHRIAADVRERRWFTGSANGTSGESMTERAECITEVLPGSAPETGVHEAAISAINLRAQLNRILADAISDESKLKELRAAVVANKNAAEQAWFQESDDGTDWAPMPADRYRRLSQSAAR